MGLGPAGFEGIQFGELSAADAAAMPIAGEARERLEQEKNLTGVDVNADWGEYFVEASWAVAYDNGTVRDGRQDLDRHFWALSVTRTLSSSAGVALRAMGSTPNATAGAGEARPIASNATADGKQQNRRVELKLQPIVEG